MRHLFFIESLSTCFVVLLFFLKIQLVHLETPCKLLKAVFSVPRTSTGGHVNQRITVFYIFEREETLFYYTVVDKSWYMPFFALITGQIKILIFSPVFAFISLTELPCRVCLPKMGHLVKKFRPSQLKKTSGMNSEKFLQTSDE
jgi:hypothetical protein